MMNIQFAVKDERLYLIEVNPRASRTVPFISKCIGDQPHRSGSQGMGKARNLVRPEAGQAGRRDRGRSMPHRLGDQGGGVLLRPVRQRRPGPRTGDAFDRRGVGMARHSARHTPKVRPAQETNSRTRVSWSFP
jgi:hypothetical protein